MLATIVVLAVLLIVTNTYWWLSRRAMEDAMELLAKKTTGHDLSWLMSAIERETARGRKLQIIQRAEFIDGDGRRL